MLPLFSVCWCVYQY